MPRGDKAKYTDKQKRKAAKIKEGYRRKGVSQAEAEHRAWATVNKIDKGGKQPGGSGRDKGIGKATVRDTGRKGGSTKAIRIKRRNSRR